MQTKPSVTAGLWHPEGATGASFGMAAFVLLLAGGSNALTLLTPQPRLTAPSRLCVQRSPPPALRVSPPAGFQWGEADRERTADRTLRQLDGTILDRVVRLGNHVPAFASLTYFGLISMTMQTMRMPDMAATLRAVITRAVGPTTNKAFSMLFLTPVTPAPFVFLIWPVIALLQFLTVTCERRPPRSRPSPATSRS